MKCKFQLKKEENYIGTNIILNWKKGDSTERREAFGLSGLCSQEAGRESCYTPGSVCAHTQEMHTRSISFVAKKN